MLEILATGVVVALGGAGLIVFPICILAVIVKVVRVWRGIDNGR